MIFMVRSQLSFLIVRELYESLDIIFNIEVVVIESWLPILLVFATFMILPQHFVNFFVS